MKMLPVDSSNLSAVGYDPKTNIMHIRFQSGRLYAYYDVPENIYHDLMNADSLGSFFNSFIKDFFRYTKLS